MFCYSSLQFPCLTPVYVYLVKTHASLQLSLVEEVTLCLNTSSSVHSTFLKCWQTALWCCRISLMLHCGMGIPARSTEIHIFLTNFTKNQASNRPTPWLISPQRFQTSWHLWKWSELKIRGFVTNPICHLPKWSEIPAHTVRLFTGFPERIMSCHVTEASHRYWFYFSLFKLTLNGICLYPLNSCAKKAKKLSSITAMTVVFLVTFHKLKWKDNKFEFFTDSSFNKKSI